MRRITICLAIAACFLIFSFNAALAQTTPGIADSIASVILNQKRTFRVLLPSNYDPKQDTKYDVLYVTDGEWNLQLASDIQRFLVESGFMPHNIIVSIHHPSRDKDLTPTAGEDSSIFGGADNFLSFLEKELIPYINKKYPASGTNTLFGHSYGGLFVTYALLTNPRPFDFYIAADPSFWWDNRYITKLAADKLDPDLHNNKTLFITGRGGAQSEGMGIPAIDSVLKLKAPTGLRWKIVDYPGETHNSVKLKSVYDGLKFTYDGFNAYFAVHPQKGIVMQGKPYKVWVFSPSDLIPLRYTIDGTEPGAQSELAKQEITLSGPSVVTVKAFTSRKVYDKTIKVEFKEGDMIKAGRKPKNIKPGGLRFSYYEGAWDSLPNFGKLKPVHTGIADKDFRLEKLPRQTNFGLLLEGYVEIKEDGYYVFVLDSDDGSNMYLSNRLLIDFDGLHGSGDARTCLVPLQKGFHPVKIEMFQKEGGMNLFLGYVTPAIKDPMPVPIPFEVMYSD